MNVLMLADNLVKGGKERRLVELLRYFDNISVKITLIILREKVEYPEVYDFKNTELIIVKRNIKQDPSVFFKLFGICRKIKPDIIHSWGSMPSIYALPSVIFLRIPLINAMIADAKCSSQERFRLKVTKPFSKIILSNSRAGLKAYGVNDSIGLVIYNGFNFDRLVNINNSVYKKSTKYSIGMVAAFYSRKDYQTYLSVANEITKLRDDVTFYAVGDGEQKEKYTLLYAENKRIVFTGNINNVESLIEILDIGVLLSNSNEHLEGISNSILEIMAFGRPVIASKGGGTDEIIDDRQNGFLIDAFSNDQLKDRIWFLLENESTRLKMGEKAKMDIREKFSIDQMCKKTFQLYEKTLRQ